MKGHSTHRHPHASPNPTTPKKLNTKSPPINTQTKQAFVLKDRLDKHMWLGVGINLVAMCLVSATTFFDKENQTGRRGLCLCCICRLGVGYTRKPFALQHTYVCLLYFHSSPTNQPIHNPLPSYVTREPRPARRGGVHPAVVPGAGDAVRVRGEGDGGGRPAPHVAHRPRGADVYGCVCGDAISRGMDGPESVVGHGTNTTTNPTPNTN